MTDPTAGILAIGTVALLGVLSLVAEMELARRRRVREQELLEDE